MTDDTMTPEEQERSRARSVVGDAVSDALDRAFERLDRALLAADVSEEAVTDALRGYPDFADGWDEWRESDDDHRRHRERLRKGATGG